MSSNQLKGKRRKNKSSNKISFDEEIVMKDAPQFKNLGNKINEDSKNELIANLNSSFPNKKSRKRKKNDKDGTPNKVNRSNKDEFEASKVDKLDDDEFEASNKAENNQIELGESDSSNKKNSKKGVDMEAKKRKDKKKKDITQKKSVQTESVSNENDAGDTNQNKQEENDSQNPDVQEELNPLNPKIKRVDSIRAMKRKKHELLLQEKKNKSELKMQQNCLNYLSQWRHNREGWKFEKLKQIWLQQHLFDSTRIPDEFWQTVVEYFDGCKGKSRSDLIKDALKVMESYEKDDKELDDRYNRSREIVQCLQE